MHVDHRLISPNHHVPNLSHYIRDKVRPRREGRRKEPKTDHSFPSTPTQHEEQSNPEWGTESSSTASLSTLYCNPLILGAIEYKDHEKLGVGHRLA
jgi:hypothetical protein